MPTSFAPEDIASRINGLRESDWVTLEKVARLYAWSTTYGHEDLMQETLTRVLDGRRAWPFELPATVFLCGVMKSIAWEWRRESEAELPAEIAEQHPTDPISSLQAKAVARRILALFDGDASARQRLAAMIEGLGEEALSVIEAFADDIVALQMVAGMMFGLDPEQLKKLSGLGSTEYFSKRKKILRRFDKLRETGLP